MPTLATNKRALHDYHILEEFEAGIVLTGSEVKSVKGGRCNLKGSYVTGRDGEIWLINAHVSPYAMSSSQRGYEPTRSRKLLLHEREIASLTGKLSSKGLTVLPLSIYTKKSLIKVKIAVCRGKKLHDKRELMKKRDADRQVRQLLRNKA
ncbi:MAG: SsrA-binding protein SmpB [Patescibacteria group bacterium]